MSNIIIDQDEQENEGSVVDLFYTYCSHEFGSDFVDTLTDNDFYGYLMYDIRPNFGDVAIFQELVNMVSGMKNISVKQILYDFNHFIRNYYEDIEVKVKPGKIF